MNVFQRSWQITKLSFNVIKEDKELLLFPLLSFIFSLILLVSMVFPTLFANAVVPENLGEVASYGVLFVVYLGLAFIATFFNVCVVFTTKTRFEGGDATFMDSIKFAFSKIHLIFSWAIVSATVGIILRFLDNLARRNKGVGFIIGKILVSMLGMVWSILTLFVVPGLVYYDLGPIKSIKKSVEVLKKTWGESLIRHYGLGMIQFLVTFGLVFLLVAGAILMIEFPVTILLSYIATMIVIIIGVSLMFTIANSIFNTALFVYGDTGRVPSYFPEEVMRNAFQKKQ